MLHRRLLWKHRFDTVVLVRAMCKYLDKNNENNGKIEYEELFHFAQDGSTRIEIHLDDVEDKIRDALIQMKAAAAAAVALSNLRIWSMTDLSMNKLKIEVVGGSCGSNSKTSSIEFGVGVPWWGVMLLAFFCSGIVFGGAFFYWRRKHKEQMRNDVKAILAEYMVRSKLKNEIGDLSRTQHLLLGKPLQTELGLAGCQPFTMPLQFPSKQPVNLSQPTQSP